VFRNISTKQNVRLTQDSNQSILDQETKLLQAGKVNGLCRNLARFV